jgi:hypothetical protein
VDAALAKDRAQRIPDVAEFAARLAAFAPEVGRFSAQRIASVLGRPSTNPSGVVAPAQSAPSLAAPVQKPVVTTAGATLESGPTRPAGRRAPVVIATLAVLGAAAVGAAFLTRANQDAPVSPVPSQPTQAVATEPAIVPEAPAPAVTVSPAVSAPAAVSATEPPAPPASASAPVPSVAPGSVPAARETKPRRRPGAGVSHPATPADPFGGVR